nr:hypothetical protein [Tanacetum cinerariifolium]
MLTKGIKQSESYQMFIKYSAGLIPPKKSRALELGKSISLTEAIEKEVTMQVHVTHARIVTEYVPEPTRRRPSVSSSSVFSRLVLLSSTSSFFSSSSLVSTHLIFSSSSSSSDYSLSCSDP